MPAGINLDEIWHLDKSQISMFWPQISTLIEGHPDDLPTYYSPEHVKEMLETAELDAWVGFKNYSAEIELAALLAFEVYPLRTDYKFVWIGGVNWKKFMPGSLEKIEKYALLNGAERLKADCKAGWFRLLKPYLFTADKIVMSKSLTRTWGH